MEVISKINESYRLEIQQLREVCQEAERDSLAGQCKLETLNTTESYVAKDSTGKIDKSTV